METENLDLKTLKINSSKVAMLFNYQHDTDIFSLASHDCQLDLNCTFLYLQVWTYSWHGNDCWAHVQL